MKQFVHYAFLSSLLLLAVGTTPVLAEFQTVTITSSRDGAKQPALMYAPTSEKAQAVPLLVVLHTWSGDYTQKGFGDECLVECKKRQWAIIQPNFRGPNRQPQACGSELAVQDVLDAVTYMKKHTRVDERRIYLVGTSGGGHMSMLMAGRAPQVWAGVSAWVGISDLAAWHRETKLADRKYYLEVEASCGGAPGTSKAVDEQYKQRSPLTHLPRAKGVALDINAGIHDGHTGSVPISHSLHAFNALAEVNGKSNQKLSLQQIQFMTKDRKIPKELSVEGAEESGRKHAILFRRTAGPARVTIFQGGHEGDMGAAVAWLAKQVKKPEGSAGK